MKKLLFDLMATQPNGKSKRHGGGKYGEVVFHRMVERGISFSCFYDSSKWLSPETEALCKKHDIPLYDCHTRSVGEIVKENGFERLYSALPAAWLLTLDKDCEMYGTLHGLRFLETPRDWYFLKYKNSFREVVKFFISKCFSSLWDEYRKWKYNRIYFNTGLHFVTVSEHSRMAIASYFPEYKGEVRTFYSPNTSRGGVERVLSEQKDTAESYLLLVSGNRWEKNNLRAIIAFDRLVTNHQVDSRVRMKVTGCSKDNFKYKIKNDDRFDFLGYVDEDELERLYAGAYLFVYPSLNEGFGYPPLEAMRHKVPVIASPFTSMAEVLSGGVLFFNPFSVEEIMNRIMMMMNPEVHDRYTEKGYEQYKYIKERQDRDLDALIDYLIADSPS